MDEQREEQRYCVLFINGTWRYYFLDEMADLAERYRPVDVAAIFRVDNARDYKQELFEIVEKVNKKAATALLEHLNANW
jgi:hypothetical protein